MSTTAHNISVQIIVEMCHRLLHVAILLMHSVSIPYPSSCHEDMFHNVFVYIASEPVFVHNS